MFADKQQFAMIVLACVIGFFWWTKTSSCRTLIGEFLTCLFLMFVCFAMIWSFVCCSFRRISNDNH